MKPHKIGTDPHPQILDNLAQEHAAMHGPDCPCDYEVDAFIEFSHDLRDQMRWGREDR